MSCYLDSLITDKISVLEAMRRLDRCACKVLFIVNDCKLVAAITDGDIRRWILKKGSLEERISEVANFNPKFIVEAERKSAKERMLKEGIDALPIVDDTFNVIDIVYLHDTESSMNTEEILDIPVVVMAGGQGTRLYPYTKILPKPLIPVGDLPITEHIINSFKKIGCTNYFMIVNHKKNMIKAYFNEVQKDYSIIFMDEDIPLGTGGGLRLLKDTLNSPFVLTNCDTIIMEDYRKIYKMHHQRHNIITMICSLKELKIQYGIVNIGADGCISDMTEKPQLSFLTNTGSYIVEPEVIDLIDQNECVGFPDIIQRVIDRGYSVGVYPVSEYAWMDMGQFDTLEQMRSRLENCG
jgi:dTDP-glucose pyrophosphorylase